MKGYMKKFLLFLIAGLTLSLAQASSNTQTVTDASDFASALKLSGFEQLKASLIDNAPNPAARIISRMNLEQRAHALKTVCGIYSSVKNVLNLPHIEEFLLQNNEILKNWQQLELERKDIYPEVPQLFKDLVQSASRQTFTPIPTRIDVKNGGHINSAAMAVLPDQWLIFLNLTDNKTPLLGCTFDQLPQRQQLSILHHEFAHSSTFYGDIAILSIANEVIANENFLNYIHTCTESWVDLTAIAHAHDPLEVGQGLKEYFRNRYYEIPTNNQAQIQHVAHRLKAIELAMAIVKNNTSPAQTKSSLSSKLLATLRRMPK